MFQNLEYLNRPTQPEIKNTSDKPKMRYKSLLRCATSRFRKIKAPMPIRPNQKDNLPIRTQFNYETITCLRYKTDVRVSSCIGCWYGQIFVYSRAALALWGALA